MTPRVRIEGLRREHLEQAVARGESNSRIMRTFGVTYAQLRLHVAAMNGDARPKQPRQSRGSHGTEAGWATHKRKKQRQCAACRSAHAARFAAEKASRAKALATKRFRSAA